MAWEKYSASTIPCLGVLRAYRSNQPPSSGATTAVVASLSVNVTNCLSGMVMRNNNRRLNVEEYDQTVRQHRRKLSERRVFVTWMFGVLKPPWPNSDHFILCVIILGKGATFFPIKCP